MSLKTGSRSLLKRSSEEVPQKKRKDWLARQEYLKQLDSDIQKFFGFIRHTQH